MTEDSTNDPAKDIGNDDLKAKMRAALDKKNAGRQGVKKDGPLQEKAHGSEVVGTGPKLHRRKAGGGGS